MDHEFDRKPDDSQDKHEQAKSSFEDLQKLMEQFQITADEPKTEQGELESEAEQTEEELPTEESVLSVDELIERAVSDEEQATGATDEVVTQPAQENESLPAEPETKKPEIKESKPVKSDEVAEASKSEDAQQKKSSSKKTAAKKKVIRKKELKPEMTQEEREQREREVILENSVKRRRPDQPVATVNLNQKSQQTKKSTTVKKSTSKKKTTKNSKKAIARRRKKRLMQLGTVIVLLLVAIVLIVSAVKGLSNRSAKNDPAAGSAVLTDAEKAEKRKQEGPASQQKTKQYEAIQDDDSLPAYAKKYPGLYSNAVKKPNKLSKEKVCYLTFDDGPSTSNTPGILDTLKEEKVKATFFVVTSEIDEETAPILQRIVDEGHTLCIHANEHEYGSLYASTEAYLEDFANAYDKIYELTGYRVQGFRFPGGSNGQVNGSGCYDEIVTEMTRRGFEYYDWNAYAHDAEGGNYSAEEMAAYAVHEVDISSRNDVILLMHDTYGKQKTVVALQQIIRQLKDEGIRMLPITNSTRPVHFEVSDATPQEYDESAEEEADNSSSTDEDTDSSDSNTEDN